MSIPTSGPVTSLDCRYAPMGWWGDAGCSGPLTVRAAWLFAPEEWRPEGLIDIVDYCEAHFARIKKIRQSVEHGPTLLEVIRL